MIQATQTIRIKKPLQRLSSEYVSTEISLIKKLIWLYFLLLLFEGALRKWFLPGLSQGLLIIRDPVVIWIYFIAYKKGLLSLQNKYIQTLIRWTLICGLISLLVKAHPLTIAYGIRTNLLHFPLIFVMGRVLTLQDVISFGKAFLILALPMTWVVAQQFQADRFDIMNVASGGTGHQMMTSGDKVRASGTFSFISGIVFYYCFAIAFIIYGFLQKEIFTKWVLYLGTGATFLAMVTAGSRSVIAESLQVFACLGFLAYFKPNQFGKITLSSFFLLSIGLFLHSQIALFQEGLEFLSMRFEEAANVEGNPIEAYFIRYWEIIYSPFRSLNFQSVQGWLGNGIGAGTRAGAALGRGYGFELDWSRHIYENGAILGLIFIFIRIWITRDLLSVCISAIKKNSYLAILLWGAAAPVILFGILGQPTNLGFAAFGGGLCLAAARKGPSS
ncbi:MAG: hypothetical protein HN553_09665 [Opitutae bacterium]|nr:hypothetical protein [Opitutae bacterium]